MSLRIMLATITAALTPVANPLAAAGPAQATAVAPTAPPPVAPSPELTARCAALTQLSIPGGRVLSTRAVGEGVFTEVDALDFPPPIAPIPAHCRVSLQLTPTADSDIRAEVWMPAHDWNGRFWGLGNGGFAGYLSTLEVAVAVQSGYAAMTTDTGHQFVGTEEWARGHPERVVDFAHRAVHLSTLAGKQITGAFFGRSPDHSYFSSCSNGGRQALMEAQLYPEDYDGIIAGAPAARWMELTVLGFGNNALALRQAPIPARKTAALQREVLAQCDALDGFVDGVLSEPRACHLDLRRLECRAAETDDCFTTAQVAALQKIYAGEHVGSTRFPGFSPGGEVGTPRNPGWEQWIFGDSETPSWQSDFLQRTMRDLVTGDKDWTVDRLDLQKDFPRAARSPASVISVSPDLRAFARRGGKLILYHGWSDAGIPPEATIQFYESMTKQLGRDRMKAMTRLYMVPGMQHCGTGPGVSWFNQFMAPGPSEPGNDIRVALQDWVERGQAPSNLWATRPADPMSVFADPKTARIERELPLCPYPAVARYAGSGDPLRRESYRCAP